MLRRIEHRIQYLDDQQTHILPTDDGDLDWPGAFPVTFTNGFLKDSTLTGTIQIYAQAQADQCKGVGNSACVVLDGAGARGLLGPDVPNIGGYSPAYRSHRRTPRERYRRNSRSLSATRARVDQKESGADSAGRSR